MSKLALKTLIFSFSILAFSNSYADVYQDYEIEPPENGAVVCRAYIERFSLWNRTTACANGCQEVALPSRYCRSGRGLESAINLGGEQMRVAIVGDFYQYSDRPNFQFANNTVDPSNSEHVCQARIVDQENQITTVSHLEEELCYAGAEVVYWDGENSRRGRVEVAYDFHYSSPENVQIAEVYREQRLPPETGMLRPASYNREVSL